MTKNKDFTAKILVTGGLGFIGSEFIRLLERETAAEIVNVDAVTYAGDRRRLKGYDRSRLYVQDIADPGAMRCLFAAEGPDYVVNFAAESHVDRSIEDSSAFIRTNVLGTQVLLEMSRRTGVKRFIQISTDEIYGDLGPDAPSSKEDDPIRPSSPYSASKAAADLLALSFVRTHDLDVVITRCLSGSTLIPILIEGVRRNVRLSELYRMVEVEHLGIFVLGYDKSTNKIDWHRIEKVFKNVNTKSMLEIKTRYGRRVRLTCDHKVFRLTKDEDARTGKPIHRTIPMQGEEVRADLLRKGDKIAVGLKTTEGEHCAFRLDLGSFCRRQKWSRTIRMMKQPDSVDLSRMRDFRMSKRSWFRYRKNGWIPLDAAKTWDGFKIGSSGSASWVPSVIRMDDDLLWLFGLIVAEGCSVSNNHDRVISVSSDEANINRAVDLIHSKFGLHCEKRFDFNGVPTCYIRSKIVVSFLIWLLGLGKSKKTRIPEIILNLPNARLKYFLQGFFDGDGIHSGKSVLCGYKSKGMKKGRVANLFKVVTASEDFATEMVEVLARFGIIASFGSQDVVLRGKIYRAYSVEASGLDDIRPSRWRDHGNGQKSSYLSNASEDILWTSVSSISTCENEDETYDLCVEGIHTYVVSSGIVVHNCSNNYGPWQHPEKLVPLMATRALKGGRLPVYGTGKNVRDWIHVEDHCAGILLALVKGAKGRVYNFGGNSERDNLTVVRTILASVGADLGLIEFVEDRKGHDFRYSIDFSRATRELGWTPMKTFEVGIYETVKWYKDNEWWWRKES